MQQWFLPGPLEEEPDDPPPGPRAESAEMSILAVFLDRRDPENLASDAERFANRAVVWIDLMANARYLHPITGACMGFHLWRLAGLYAAARRLTPVRREQNLEHLDTYPQVGGHIDRQVRTLSFGQRMRGELVCALLHDPEFVFFDEPTVRLDADSRALPGQFLGKADFFASKTAVIVSHDPEIITSFASRCIEMERGQIVFDGPTEEIARREQVRYLVEFAEPSTAAMPPPVAPDMAVECGVRDLKATFETGTGEVVIQKWIGDLLRDRPTVSLTRRNVLAPRQPDTKSNGGRNAA